MSRTPQSKPPQRTATRALGFRAGNVVAGELMTFIYGAVYKGISRWQERFGLLPATSPTANERIRRQYVTQRSKKTLITTRGFVATGGVVLGLRCKAQQVLASLTSSRFCLRFGSFLGERRISQRGFAQSEPHSQALRHKGKTNP